MLILDILAPIRGNNAHLGNSSLYLTRPQSDRLSCETKAGR